MNYRFDEEVWTGRRDDGEPGETRRVFNQVAPLAGEASMEGASVIVGFCSDEGVRRNQGRVGAVQGPRELRRALAGLPAKPDVTLLDAGDVACDNGDLEAAQAELAGIVCDVLAKGGMPVVFGGGHEIAWGTYSGLREYLARAPARRLLILNFDAHFDLRQARPANSGTPFDQMACDCAARGVPFNYACFGVSDLANTAALFERARQLDVCYELDMNMQERDLPRRLEQIGRLIDAADDVYLTVDLDVLPGAVAPGVSAPAALGVPLSVVEAMVQAVRASGKLRAADIAEYNPAFDIDRRTARVAARLAHRLL